MIGSLQTALHQLEVCALAHWIANHAESRLRVHRSCGNSGLTSAIEPGNIGVPTRPATHQAATHVWLDGVLPSRCATSCPVSFAETAARAEPSQLPANAQQQHKPHQHRRGLVTPSRNRTIARDNTHSDTAHSIVLWSTFRTGDTAHPEHSGTETT